MTNNYKAETVVSVWVKCFHYLWTINTIVGMIISCYCVRKTVVFSNTAIYQHVWTIGPVKYVY